MLIAGVWLFSGWYQIVLLYSRHYGEQAAASAGVLYVLWTSSAVREQLPLASEGRPCVQLVKCDHPPRLHWILPCWKAPGYDTQAGCWHMSSALWIPFWLPFVLLATPTALLWWHDLRRIPPGHCQRCGYDLTGNVSGRCPECGTPIEREGKPA